MSIYAFDTDLFNQQFLPPRKRNPIFKAWGKVLLKPLQYLRDLLFDTYVDGFVGDVAKGYTSTYIYKEGDLVYYETDGGLYYCILASVGNAPTSITYFEPAVFSVGDRFGYIDKAVYEVTDEALASEPNVIMIGGYYVRKIQDVFLGLKARTLCTSQKRAFEYLLNTYFGTSINEPVDVNDIYIENIAGGDVSFYYGLTESESAAIFNTDENQETYIGTTLYTNSYNFTIKIPISVYDSFIPSEPSGTTTKKDNIVRNFADKYVLAGIKYSITPY